MLQTTPRPPAYENLPTSGAFGKEPAISVGGIVSFATLVVALLSVYGVTISPELQQFADQYGLVLAGFVVVALPYVTSRIIRGKVYSPASVQALLNNRA
ncbi:MAG: hypothetical protein E6Q97_05735 [Desulfurellales bacterium]|nr:MAG: hypothetical protein E6Q97_05735 [Desulfurellales bacterium]